MPDKTVDEIYIAVKVGNPNRISLQEFKQQLGEIWDDIINKSNKNHIIGYEEGEKLWRTYIDINDLRPELTKAGLLPKE